MVDLETRRAFEDAARYFPTPLQALSFFDKYSRYNNEKGRRETWIETVDRTVSFLRELSENRLSETEYQEIHTAILEMKAMPSMRLLAMAGDAARRNHMSIYNCAYCAVDSTDTFVEALLIAMAGCGIGYSVEAHYIDQLPIVAHNRSYSSLALVQEPELEGQRVGYTHTVEDSAEGWGEALRHGLDAWMNGSDVVV